MRLGKERLGQTIAHVMELPRDLVLDVPRITMVGREEMHLENHKGIIEYGPGHLKINLNRGYLEIYGEGLEIAVLRTEEMLITGRIQDIRFAE